jgi:23S rRNA (guanosine2251-2'-O)-methyltransferase
VTHEDGFWIWGRHSVLEALRAGSVQSILMAGGRRRAGVLEEIERLAAQHNVPLRYASTAEVERVAPGQNIQGVAAVVSRPATVRLPELLGLVAGGPDRPFLLVLDHIQDPQNFGSLLRTAYAAGVHGVVVPERGSAPRSGVVAKVSAGAMSHVPVVDVVNLVRAIEEMHTAGIWLVGLDGNAREVLYTVDLTMPVALVLGSEGGGLRRLTREHCDVLARLPMPGPMESLNAAVAGAIAMYEVVRQRAAKPLRVE